MQPVAQPANRQPIGCSWTIQAKYTNMDRPSCEALYPVAQENCVRG